MSWSYQFVSDNAEDATTVVGDLPVAQNVKDALTEAIAALPTDPFMAVSVSTEGEFTQGSYQQGNYSPSAGRVANEVKLVHHYPLPE